MLLEDILENSGVDYLDNQDEVTRVKDLLTKIKEEEGKTFLALDKINQKDLFIAFKNKLAKPASEGKTEILF